MGKCNPRNYLPMWQDTLRITDTTTTAPPAPYSYKTGHPSALLEVRWTWFSISTSTSTVLPDHACVTVLSLGDGNGMHRRVGLRAPVPRFRGKSCSGLAPAAVMGVGPAGVAKRYREGRVLIYIWIMRRVSRLILTGDEAAAAGHGDAMRLTVSCMHCPGCCARESRGVQDTEGQMVVRRSKTPLKGYKLNYEPN